MKLYKTDSGQARMTDNGSSNNCDKAKVSTRKIGANAEEVACRVLGEKGYFILKQNYQIRGGEIDIIAEHDGTLVFIEVKARYTHEFGLPVESITKSKIRVLKRAAAIYIHQNHLYHKLARFDVVTIDYVLGNPKIEVIENAFW